MKQALVILYDINAKCNLGVYALHIHSIITLYSPSIFITNITNSLTVTPSDEGSKPSTATGDEASSGSYS